MKAKIQIKNAVVAEVKALQDRVRAQMEVNETARQHFDDWGWSDTEFEVDAL